MFRAVSHASCLVLFWACLPAHADTFAPSITEAQWQVEQTPLVCRLRQWIPKYGAVEFVREAGHELRLEVRPVWQRLSAERARLRLQPAAWRHDLNARELGEVPVQSAAMVVDRERAQLLTKEMQRGMFPAFAYRDPERHRDVEVMVAAVRFVDAYASFMACVDALPAYDFDSVRETTIHFDAGSTRADADAAAILDRIGFWAANDPEIRRVVVTGHTDSVSWRMVNDQVSRKRAESVAGHLARCGVPREKLVTSGLGERRPAYSNRTAEGRAKNRRVVIQLVR